MQGARHVVHIGDKLVDFSEQFKLYLVTRNPNIDIPPDVKPLVSAVNFSVTRSGLEGQLLGVTPRALLRWPLLAPVCQPAPLLMHVPSTTCNAALSSAALSPLPVDAGSLSTWLSRLACLMLSGVLA